jgi:hypothetical protein
MNVWMHHLPQASSLPIVYQCPSSLVLLMPLTPRLYNKRGLAEWTNRTQNERNNNQNKDGNDTREEV